jgi:hypothetical protein
MTRTTAADLPGRSSTSGSRTAGAGLVSVLTAALAAALALLLVGAPAAVAGTSLDRAVSALSSAEPLYVDPDASDVLGSQESQIR